MKRKRNERADPHCKWIAAVVMHFMHRVDEGLLVTTAVVLIALLFIRDLRGERATEDAHVAIEENQANLLPRGEMRIFNCRASVT